jgi:hypothetical protein
MMLEHLSKRKLSKWCNSWIFDTIL